MKLQFRDSYWIYGANCVGIMILLPIIECKKEGKNGQTRLICISQWHKYPHVFYGVSEDQPGSDLQCILLYGLSPLGQNILKFRKYLCHRKLLKLANFNRLPIILCKQKWQYFINGSYMPEINMRNMMLNYFMLPGGVIRHMHTMTANCKHGQYIRLK